MAWRTQADSGDNGLAAWLRVALADAGLSQQAVADRTGVNRSTVAMMLNGKRAFSEPHFVALYTELGGDDHLPKELWKAEYRWREYQIVSESKPCYIRVWKFTPYRKGEKPDHA